MVEIFHPLPENSLLIGEKLEFFEKDRMKLILPAKGFKRLPFATFIRIDISYAKRNDIEHIIIIGSARSLVKPVNLITVEHRPEGITEEGYRSHWEQ